MNINLVNLVKPITLNNTKKGIWFTSDTHFGHKQVIKFCDRPYNSVEEMDEALIENWNSRVKPNDLVFHLGDFAMASKGRWKNLLSSLNGQKYLVLGNHDSVCWPGNYVMSMFKQVALKIVLSIDSQIVYLDHYPYLCYAGTYNNSNIIQLFGHVHSGPRQVTGADNERLQYLFPNQYDVGVDNNNYVPVSYQEILSKL